MYTGSTRSMPYTAFEKGRRQKYYDPYGYLKKRPALASSTTERHLGRTTNDFVSARGARLAAKALLHYAGVPWWASSLASNVVGDMVQPAKGQRAWGKSRYSNSAKSKRARPSTVKYRGRSRAYNKFRRGRRYSGYRRTRTRRFTRRRRLW